MARTSDQEYFTTNASSTIALADQYSGFDCWARGLTLSGSPASSGTAMASAARSVSSLESETHPIDAI